MTILAERHVDIGRLKERRPLAEVVEASGVHLRGRGRVLQGLCPFHEDLEPSFTVYRDTQRFYCFGCGVMGDVLDYVMLTERVDLPEAIRLVDSTVPALSGPLRWRTAAEPLPSVTKNTAVLAAAARFYSACLWRSPHALCYLRSRGICVNTAVALGLGYAPGNGLRAHLERVGFIGDAITASGLFIDEQERFAGRIVVPEVACGHVTWLTGRSVGDVEPRFQALPGSKPLMGRGLLSKPKVMVLTEGLFDWITLVQWGLPACATLGSHSLERVAGAVAGCRRIYIAMDLDEAGRDAAESLAVLLSPRAVIVDLPDGVKDVADLAVHQYGRETFLRLLARAVSGVRHSGVTWTETTKQEDHKS